MLSPKSEKPPEFSKLRAENTKLDPNRIHSLNLTLLRPEFSFRSHRRCHGVVNVDSFSPEIHDLAGFESVIRARHCMENSTQLPLHVVVASVAAFGGNRDEAVF